jgi:hypothetical protein
MSKSVFEPPVIVRIVSWMGKVSGCYGGSCTSGGGGGGLVLALTWLLVLLLLLGVGYVICSTAGG